VRQEQLFSGIAIATAVSLSITQPVWAATAQVTAVQINSRGSSLELILETQAGDQRPADSGNPSWRSAPPSFPGEPG